MDCGKLCTGCACSVLDPVVSCLFAMVRAACVICVCAVAGHGDWAFGGAGLTKAAGVLP